MIIINKIIPINEIISSVVAHDVQEYHDQSILASIVIYVLFYKEMHILSFIVLLMKVAAHINYCLIFNPVRERVKAIFLTSFRLLHFLTSASYSSGISACAELHIVSPDLRGPLLFHRVFIAMIWCCSAST